jgi:hypothetical protein
MSRAPTPTAYKPLVVEEAQPSTPEPVELPAPGPGHNSDLLKDVAQSVLVYIHPQAHKTLLRYSVEQTTFRGRVRVHDLIILALEEFFERRGLAGPVRAKDKPPRTRKGRGAAVE